MANKNDRDGTKPLRTKSAFVSGEQGINMMDDSMNSNNLVPGEIGADSMEMNLLAESPVVIDKQRNRSKLKMRVA